MHDATASLLDTCRPQERDGAGRPQHGHTAETVDRLHAVDARAGALLVAELSRLGVTANASTRRSPTPAG